MRRLLVFFALVLASVANAQLPEGLKFDDGFTWFECHNFETTENNKLNTTWVPEFSFRIWGHVPARSGFRLVIKSSEGKSIHETSADSFPVKMGTYEGCCVVGFWRDKMRLTATGVLTAEFYYIDGLTNKEYLARTCKIDVRKVTSVRGGPGSREPGFPRFYINRHGEILSNILYFRDVQFPSYTQLGNISYFTERRVELIVNWAEFGSQSSPALGRIAVEVDGKPVEMMVPNNNLPQDNMGFGETAGHYNVAHSDRDADKYFKGGTAYQERIGFSRSSFTLPFEWGQPLPNRAQGYVFTTAHPGSYKVTWLIDRVPVRIFRFKIGADGMGIPHEEQTKGLNLAPNAILVETEIPGKGGEFDGRLTSEFVKLGGFFGRPWQSASMKALAAAVPTKGRPFPVSSAKQ